MKKLLLAFFLLTATISLQAQQTAEGYLKSAIDKQSSGDNEGAVTDCTKALGFGENVADISNVRAVALFNLGQYDKAIDDFNRTLHANPTNALAYNYRGTCRYLLGKSDTKDKLQRQVQEAIKDFSNAIKISPKYASAYANRGTARVCVHLYNEAINDFSEAIAIDPNNAAYYNNRAFARTVVGKNTDAINDCNKALSLDPKLAAGAYRNRGNAEIKLGRYEDAIEDCRKAIDLDLQNPKGYNYRGYAYYMVGKFDLAIKDDDSSTEFRDDDSSPYWQYRDDAEVKLTKKGGVVAIVPQVAANVPRFGQADKPQTVPEPGRQLPAPAPALVVAPATVAATPAVSAPVTQAPVKQTGVVPATPTPAVTQSAVAVPAEANANNVTVQFQWLKPVADFSALPDGVLKPYGSAEIQVKIGIKSNVPLDSTAFHLYKNNVDVSDGNKMTTASIEKLKQRANVYQYNYIRTMTVGLDTTVIRLGYKNYSSEELTVVYRPQDISLHILAIGTEGQSLKYPEKDAADFAEIFSDQKGNGRLFHDVSAKVLIGDDAKALNMADEIGKWASKDYNERDVLMLFISSHGLIENGHLVITGSDYKATSIRQTTLDFKTEVVDRLEGLPCKKFIFIDACNSGAGVGDGGKAALQDVGVEINKMATSGNGITIISSSSSTEKSWEDDSWENGAFTRAIKDGLQGMKADKDGSGFVTMNELFEYVKIRVADLLSQAGKKDENGNPVTQTPKMINPRGDVSIYSIAPVKSN